jgi:hypothetical protein
LPPNGTGIPVYVNKGAAIISGCKDRYCRPDRTDQQAMERGEITMYMDDYVGGPYNPGYRAEVQIGRPLVDVPFYPGAPRWIPRCMGDKCSLDAAGGHSAVETGNDGGQP